LGQGNDVLFHDWASRAFDYDAATVVIAGAITRILNDRVMVDPGVRLPQPNPSTAICCKGCAATGVIIPNQVQGDLNFQKTCVAVVTNVNPATMIPGGIVLNNITPNQSLALSKVTIIDSTTVPALCLVSGDIVLSNFGNHVLKKTNAATEVSCTVIRDLIVFD